MKKKIFLFIAVLLSKSVFSQIDSTKKWTYSIYGEFYYSYDFSNPSNHEKSNFLYNHKRHNELNVNLFLVKANYSEKKYRANFGLMVGNYANYNLSSEPNWAQFVYEANAGVKLSEKRNLWLDVGIMPSHIGFESAISADCWTLTRSILAENSPYFETGLKLTHTSKNEKLTLSAMYLNGWQRIQKPTNYQLPSFGTQISYKPKKNLSLNYSNFLGSDKPDSLKAFRHFHNFYMQYDLLKNIGFIAGFDFGFENSIGSKFRNWYTPVLIFRARTGKKTYLAFRGEYYVDKNQVLISTGTPNGFQTFGVSSNFDLVINEKLKWRIEGKVFHSKDKIFSSYKANQNFSITTNLTIKID